VRIKPVRKIIQLLFLPIAYAGFVVPSMTHIIYPSIHCYSCPLSIYICPVGIVQNFVKMPSFPFYFLGWLVVYGVAFGRTICGWLCPFGLFNDILSPLNRIKHPPRILPKIFIAVFIATMFISSYSINPRAAVGVVALTLLFLFILHDLHLAKYLLLTFSLIMALVFADTIFCKSCAVATLESSFPYLLMSLLRKSSVQVDFTSISFFVHISVLVIAICGITTTAKRFWCRYLCPMGALLAIFNRVSFITIRRNKERCEGSEKKKCSSECIKACPMGVTGIAKRKTIDSGDCIRCGACADACPNHELRLTIRFLPLSTTADSADKEAIKTDKKH